MVWKKKKNEIKECKSKIYEIVKLKNVINFYGIKLGNG